MISVCGVYKKFCSNLKRGIIYGLQDFGRSFFNLKTADQVTLRRDEFWVLKNISFQVQRGESIGLIGLNGSGKTTLLRLISGILPVNSGKIFIKGKLESMLALGVGFHPHLSGLENIYLKASLLGFSQIKIKSKMRSIIDYSGLGDFIHSPVGSYSAGMRIRLGFSIAIHVEPEIMILDEVLGVTDLSFLNKSIKSLSQFFKRSKSIIVVSHDMNKIEDLCNRVIVLEKGQIIFDGDKYQGIDYYLKAVDFESDRYNIKGKYFSDYNNFIIQESHVFGSFEEVQVSTICLVKKSDIKVSMIIGIHSKAKQLLNNEFFEGGDNIFKIKESGLYQIDTRITDLNLATGEYSIQVIFYNQETQERLGSKSIDGAFCVLDRENPMPVKNHFYHLSSEVKVL